VRPSNLISLSAILKGQLFVSKLNREAINMSRYNMTLRPVKNAGGNPFAFGNLAAVSLQDFGSTQLFLLINRNFIIPARPHEGMRQGTIGFTDPQRKWMNISLAPDEIVEVEPFRQPIGGSDPHAVPFIGRMEVELSWYTPGKVSSEPINEQKLVERFLQVHNQQILSTGQILVTESQGSPGIRMLITKLSPIDFGLDEAPKRPLRTGVISSETEIHVVKTAIPLIAASTTTQRNAILNSNFSFEDIGIGGLDQEFAILFRRAFASRLFPPHLIDKMGIQHVRGLLLFGPPGTGKTLIARQIGKTLNAREPKIVNGPELLNKYVGQSEENVRKIFVDAEKEYKEKGDNSGLHIIIFDELDAVCKSRGSGSAGGTGVGDNIVNQLLTKLDGVEQLNNILLIGMTNRKDMIDEALLRPGRLELHLEISLPDEPGRLQILKIHTKKLRDNNMIDDNISLEQLAAKTRNFSGAELSGLIRSASSFAFERHTAVKDGKGPSVDHIENLRLIKADFELALAEMTPMFGTAEEDLQIYVKGGLFDYSTNVQKILDMGTLMTSTTQAKNNIQLSAALLHGPPGSGKTALAAQIAIDSEIPFIKIVKAQDLVGLPDLSKIQKIRQVFMDADKSPRSLILIDDIEQIIEYVESAPPRFTTTMVSALRALMAAPPPKNRRRLILATTSNRTVMAELGFLRLFDTTIPVPNIGSMSQLERVLQQVRTMSPDQIRSAMSTLRQKEGQYINIGVKSVVFTANLSQAGREEKFGDIVAERISENMVRIAA
jgi:vesicle-fusing ATPase